MQTGASLDPEVLAPSLNPRVIDTLNGTCQRQYHEVKIDKTGRIVLPGQFLLPKSGDCASALTPLTPRLVDITNGICHHQWHDSED